MTWSMVGEGATELEWRWWLVGAGDERADEAGVSLVVEDGDADAVGGQGIWVGPRTPLEQSVEAEVA
jgi:hypothetical protein